MRSNDLLRIFILLFLVPVITETPLLTAQSGSGGQPETPRELAATAQERLAYGRDYYDSTALEEAIDLSRRAIEGNPNYGEAFAILGEAHLWLQRFDRARAAIDTARRLGYAPREIDLLTAQRAVLEGRFSEGEDAFQRVLEREPYNETARVGMALLSVRDGNPAAARRALVELEGRYPENRRLLLGLIELSHEQNDTAALNRYLDRALRFHGESATVQMIAARTALETGELDQADFHGRNAVSIAPRLTDAWLLLAETAYLRGEYATARTHYESLIRLEPDNHRAWYARGVAAARGGDREAAVQSWERAGQIRRDYELPFLALEHNAIDTLPLESDVRRELAIPYREKGKALEERYLHREAEQLYRRGLQIYPYDTTLRRALAELYRGRGMRARYLQELEVIASLGGDDRELEELIESYTAVLSDSVAREWEIDQFVAERPRDRVLLVHAATPGTLDPNADGEIARYINSLLLSSQNIDPQRPVPMKHPLNRQRAGVVAEGRDAEADLTIAITFELEDRRVLAWYEAFRGNTMVPVFQGSVARSGNERIREVAQEIARRIEESVPSEGYVLDRRFEDVLISIGSIDGVAPDDRIGFVSIPGNEPLGEGRVIDTDELLAVVEWNPDGPDNLGIGDRAVHLGPAPEETDDTDEESPRRERRSANPGDQTERGNGYYTDLVKNIFQLR
ncbi:MAG: tetratricopeptide repeat protein [Alkalispirochaeta sp.]